MHDRKTTFDVVFVFTRNNKGDYCIKLCYCKYYVDGMEWYDLDDCPSRSPRWSKRVLTCLFGVFGYELCKVERRNRGC